MTVHSLTEALEDTAALVDITKRAGITMEQARLVLALLSELPARQTIRMAATAQNDRVRRINSETRRAKR